jgi:hypothetical protein
MEISNKLETRFRTFEALMNDTSRLIRMITVEVGVPDEAVALAVRVLDDFKFMVFVHMRLYLRGGYTKEAFLENYDRIVNIYDETLSPLITNRLGVDMSYEVSKAVFEIFEQIVIEGKFRSSE